MKPLVITGVGVVSAIGVGRQAFADGMRAAIQARSAAPPAGRPIEITGFDASTYLGDKGLRTLDRMTKLLVVAARLALHDAALKRDATWATSRPERVGIVVSNAYGSLEAITELDRVAKLEDARYINPSRFPLTVSNSAAGYASIWEDLRAVNVSVSDGNCGALDAVACANAFLEQRRADAHLVGGVEALSEALILAFERLGALRDGARIGEGAGLVALEAPESAAARGAMAHASVTGYGTAFVAPDRQGALVHASSAAVERAVADALADARADPRDVDVVVSGVSGLRAFDEAEIAGIDSALGAEPCIVAPKVCLGETFGAGGAMGMLSALVLMSCPPSAADRGAPAIVVRGALRAQPRTVLVTSVGYYGNASALVMRAGSR